MLGEGIEPSWALAQGILSPSRLPVSPPEPGCRREAMKGRLPFLPLQALRMHRIP